MQTGCMTQRTYFAVHFILMSCTPDIVNDARNKNIPRIGKLPYGAKRGFIERNALLKERLY